MKHILVTGASGFIGSALCHLLLGKKYSVRCLFRSKQVTDKLPSNAEIRYIGEIDENTDWTEALKGVEAVVHLAARVHVMKDTSANPLDEFRKVNTEGTRRLAEAAAKAGVRRIIYLSTIKVSGEGTEKHAFSEGDTIHPSDPYAISKHEAELLLHEIASATGIEFVILRPPLVYGPNVKANFLRLLELVSRGIPLPLALINNKRSMIYLGNLIDAIVKCIEHPTAANQTFLVSDRQDISTPDLIRMIAKTMGKKAKLLSIPSVALKVLGKITGKQSEVERLIGSLQIDSSRIRNTLDWKPPFTLEEGISETVKWYLNTGDISKRG